MGEVIGFKPPEEPAEESVPTSEFDMLIITEGLYVLEERCPHCRSHAFSDVIEYVELEDKDKKVLLLGDLLICPDCTLPFFVVTFPPLPTSLPIMTRWKVPVHG